MELGDVDVAGSGWNAGHLGVAGGQVLTHEDAGHNVTFLVFASAFTTTVGLEL